MILITVILLAILLILILEATRETGKKTDSVCPSCGKKVQDNFIYCPYCSVSLKKICSQCQFILKPFWKVCPNCGTKIEKGENQ